MNGVIIAQKGVHFNPEIVFISVQNSCEKSTKKLYDFDKKGLNFPSENAMIVEVAKLTAQHTNFGMWLSLVERCVRDAKAAGSNPVIPTK